MIFFLKLIEFKRYFKKINRNTIDTFNINSSEPTTILKVTIEPKIQQKKVKSTNSKLEQTLSRLEISYQYEEKILALKIITMKNAHRKKNNSKM